MKEIQEQIRDDTHEWFPEIERDLLFNTVALAGEVGEFCNLLKKAERGDFALSPQLHLDMSMELADAYIYLLQCANILGIDIVEAYKVKRETNVTRFANRT